MNVTVTGVDWLVRSFGEVAVKSALDAWIRKSVFILSATARKEAPIASGLLRNWFRERFSALKWTLVNVKSYAPYVHEWRKPGKMPPLEPISLWANRKWIPIPAFVLARSIAKKWTKANPFLKRTIEAEETNVRATVQWELYGLIRKTFG